MSKYVFSQYLDSQRQNAVAPPHGDKKNLNKNNMEHEMDFDIWYDIFRGHLKTLGWKGNIDSDAARDAYDNDPELFPEDAAKELYKELMDE